MSTPSQVEVKEGVEPGDLVVVGNLALLRDGLAVMVEPEAEPPVPEIGTAPDEAPAQDQPAEEASTEGS